MSDFKQQARALIAQMTLEEKVAQTLFRAPAIERLGIPAYNWWNEALHGVARSGIATVFPQAIALAATFDPALLQQVADTIATEGRAKFHAYQKEGDRDIYKGLTFWSPNINIFRDPRWGRGHETYGEDPYLTGLLGIAFIKGLQGEDPRYLKSAACAKHYAVHSGPEAERHTMDVIVNDYDLWNTYLPQFEAAVKEGGVESVMGAYNRVLGEPACGSKLLLTDILRGKWDFAGHVVSDCWGIEDFHTRHMVTETPAESVALAIKMGCDLCCGQVFSVAAAAVEEGLLTEADIDQAVERLFVARIKLGLLGSNENPAYTSIPYEALDCPEHQALNLDVTRRAPVLLKNDGTLPLDISKLKSIAVIGPNAFSRRALEGNYEGTASRYVTPLEGIQAVAQPHGVKVRYALGCHMYKDRTTGLAEENDRLAEALIAVRHSDAVILCLGLDADIEGEEGDASNEYSSGDKPHLNLPGRQQLLLEKAYEAAAGKPVILVLLSGSALAVNWADQHVNGILQAFYPGALGGQAIAEILTGQVNPAGKLPVTFYRGDTPLPDFSDYNMTERTYRYFTGEALYPFGFGLSYTQFALERFTADAKRAVVTVKNIGSRLGRETVQIYVASPGQKERHCLCGMASVELAPGASQAVEVALSADAFTRRDAEGQRYTLSGPHRLYAGFTQPDARSTALHGTTPLQTEVIIG